MFTQLLSTYINLNVTLRLTSIYLEWETGKEGQEKYSPSCLTQVNFAVIGGPRNQALSARNSAFQSLFDGPKWTL